MEASAGLELRYLANDDDERYSIQAWKKVKPENLAFEMENMVLFYTEKMVMMVIVHSFFVCLGQIFHQLSSTADIYRYLKIHSWFSKSFTGLSRETLRTHYRCFFGMFSVTRCAGDTPHLSGKVTGQIKYQLIVILE